MKTDLLLIPMGARWAELRSAALAAEEAGFDGLWTWDHLRDPDGDPAGVPECLTTFAALAEVTAMHGPRKQPESRWQRVLRSLLYGRDVTATGWYRRAPTPFLELGTLEIGGDVRRCWVRTAKLFAATLAIVVGMLLALA